MAAIQISAVDAAAIHHTGDRRLLEMRVCVPGGAAAAVGGLAAGRSVAPSAGVLDAELRPRPENRDSGLSESVRGGGSHLHAASMGVAAGIADAVRASDGIENRRPGAGDRA